MKRLIYILIISICLFPNLISGLECTNEQRERLQKLADNVTYVLEEYEENGQTYFKVTFSGLSKELKIFQPNKFLYYYNLGESYFGDDSVPYLLDGKTYEFHIYGINVCYYDRVRDIKVHIPKINQYYNAEICSNAKEYKLCQKWYETNDISYEEFASKVNEYKENKKETITEEPNVEVDSNQKFDFMRMYDRYYWPTFIGMICLLVLLIILWIKENRKNRL